MIRSMTGYGLSQLDKADVQIRVEVKTLNSKFLDFMVRLPRRFADRENDIRILIGNKLERGKVTIMVDYLSFSDSDARQKYNEELFVAYYSDLKKLADRVYAPYDNLFQLALNSPEVIQSKPEDPADEGEWDVLRKLIDSAVEQCQTFRLTEGKTIETKLLEYVGSIGKNLHEVEAMDPRRVEKIRERISGNIKSLFEGELPDESRLEQELVFYIEKLDIHEECTRLRAHLDYFSQELKEDASSGKKLNFISQEMGREINTIGSKANDFDIQRCVVVMKEELEKIKEQLNNVV